MKNLSHIQYVLPISDYSALAEVYCVHEDLVNVEWKREKFFINKEGKVVAHFEHPSETIRVELLNRFRTPKEQKDKIYLPSLMGMQMGTILSKFLMMVHIKF